VCSSRISLTVSPKSAATSEAGARRSSHIGSTPYSVFWLRFLSFFTDHRRGEDVLADHSVSAISDESDLHILAASSTVRSCFSRLAYCEALVDRRAVTALTDTHRARCTRFTLISMIRECKGVHPGARFQLNALGN
jgi:hypothetical protein